MKSIVLFALALLSLTGCAMQSDAPSDRDPMEPTADGAAPTVDTVAPDAGTDSAAAIDAPTADAAVLDGGAEGGPSPDAGSVSPDAQPPTVDAGTDAQALPDATSHDGGQVAQPDAVSADARTDTAPVVDAGTTSDADAASGFVPVCTSTATSCANAVAADQAIRDTFTKPCSPESLRMCGGIFRDVVETLPMICRDGRWRLAGSWGGANWIPLYTCSKGCGTAGKLCDP